LLYISEEAASTNSLTGQNMPDFMGSGALHRARVRLVDTHLSNLPAGARMLPGMTLQAEIKVGTRSILGYFLAPMLRGFSEALHES
jgi:HlyD family secretion protein